MNKIRIIDLLNKIAKGEKIEARHKLFRLEYYNSREFLIAYDKSISDFTLGDLIRILNDEVEIIEENEKIEKIDKLDKTVARKDDMFSYYWDDNEEILVDKINELIDAVNELKDSDN